ncbi:MAG: hypothetical protein FWH37_04820 [Candidatus Bathyarchaeota archaeon]|nr:hypothetical protein [Candidatus Termiticorpusculum sp.]
MKQINKFLTSILIFLALSSLMVFSVNCTNVYAASKPSVPQFSVKFIDKSYDVPPAQTTDPYTGETTTEPGYHVNDGWLQVTIKNQPYTPSDDLYRLYYLVEVKGHFGDDKDWHTLIDSKSEIGYVEQSDSDYTVLTSLVRLDSGTQIDLRVKAVIGYPRKMPFWTMTIEAESGWSKVQTFTILYGSSSISPSQTANLSNQPTSDSYNPPQQPLPLYIVVILVATCIIAILIAVIAYQHKQIKKQL